ncbi:unnamed protein product [Ectocarpus sp. 4 AP-2014]
MSTFTDQQQQQQPIPPPEEALRKELVMLQAQRDALEMEADAIASELKSPGANGEAPVGVKGALVDSDGFPLAGFDLFNVREKRHRFNCIQTDHKAVMSRIEKSLHALHDARLARPTPLPTASSVTAATPPASSLIGRDSAAAAASMSLAPIAKVNQVKTSQQGICMFACEGCFEYHSSLRVCRASTQRVFGGALWCAEPRSMCLVQDDDAHARTMKMSHIHDVLSVVATCVVVCIPPYLGSVRAFPATHGSPTFKLAPMVSFTQPSCIAVHVGLLSIQYNRLDTHAPAGNATWYHFV